MASLHWLVLGLAIAVVEQLYYDSAERLRNHIRKKMYISAYNSRQVKLPVLDAHRIQITRLYLK